MQRKNFSPPVVLDTRVVAGSGGGPDKTILNSPRFFDRLGYRMVCAYMHPPGDKGFNKLRDKAAAWGAPLWSVPDRGPWDWQVVSRLLAICRREKVSIWHGHDYKSNALGLLIKPFWPMRLVTTVHGWVEETRRTPLYYQIDKYCLPHYESVLCVAPDLVEAAKSCGVQPDRGILIENGIDTEEFARRKTTAEAKACLGWAPDRIVVGGVGRLSPEKGFDLLIQSLPSLLKQGYPMELVIIGEGQEKARLESLAQSLGLADRVHLLGYQSDTRTYYEAMDLYALSSLREGLPNVLLEALALEVPVVATRINGVPRLIQDGVNGLLVESGSVESLTQGIGRLIANADLGDRFRKNGRQVIEDRYSFAGRIEKIRQIYDRLLAQPNN